MGTTEVVLKTIELIHQICKRLQTMHIKQKSNANRCRSDLEFQVGDFVFLKVSP